MPAADPVNEMEWLKPKPTLDMFRYGIWQSDHL